LRFFDIINNIVYYVFMYRFTTENKSYYFKFNGNENLIFYVEQQPKFESLLEQKKQYIQQPTTKSSDFNILCHMKHKINKENVKAIYKVNDGSTGKTFIILNNMNGIIVHHGSGKYIIGEDTGNISREIHLPQYLGNKRYGE